MSLALALPLAIAWGRACNEARSEREVVVAGVSIYLNFDGTCEEAFTFYGGVFGTQLVAPIMRMGEAPPDEDGAGTPAEEADRVMHVALPILGGARIMGSDISPSRGHVLTHGNDAHINLECDDVDQLNHLFFALSEDATETFGPVAMFWGDHYATVRDRFGVNWMLVAPVDTARGASPA